MSYDPGSPGSPGDRPGDRPGQGWQGGQPGQPGQPGQHYPGGYGHPQQPPPPGWGQQPPAGMPPTQMTPGAAAGGFSALFDFSFATFATPSLIRLLYIVGIVLIGLYYIGVVITLFATSALAGLVALVFGAVAALFMVALLRVSLEFYFAVVRMSEDIHNRR